MASLTAPVLPATAKSFWLVSSLRTIFFLTIALTLAGIYAATRVPISVFPDTNFPRVVVDGAAHKRTVVLGIRTAQTVQIVSGIAPGDNVIVQGSYGLDANREVQTGSDKPSAGSEKAKGEDKD